MSPTKIERCLRDIRNEQKVGDRIAISHFVSPSVMESEHGDLIAVLKIEGHPFDTASNQRLNELQRRWQRSVDRFDEGYVLMGSLHRSQVESCELKSKARGLALELDATYHARYDAQPLYQNCLYLTVVRRGLSGDANRGWGHWFRSLSKRYMHEQRHLIRQAHLDELMQQLQQLLVSLAPYKPQLLGCNDRVGGNSECLAFVSQFVNGSADVAHLKLSHYPNTSNRLLTQRDCYAFPTAHVGRSICRKRLYFGDAIQLGCDGSEKVQYAAMISIKHYCNHTHAFILDQLMQLPVRFIATHHFLGLDKITSERLIKRQTRKMVIADEGSRVDVSGIEQLRINNQRDNQRMGWHQHSIRIIADSKDELDESCRCVIDTLLQVGITAVRESVGQQAAFWAQVPGNYRWMTRPSLISSRNFCDLFPLHNYRCGYFERNQLGQALALLQSAGATPFWLNCHLPGAPNSFSLGHTMLIGSSGSGKTVLLSFVALMLMRYGGTVCIIDRDQAMQLLVRALGGSYWVLHPEVETACGQLAMNPLQMPDSTANRSFCKQWLVCLAKEHHDSHIEAIAQQQLHECVDYCYEQLAPQHRTLRNAIALLPVNFQYMMHIRRWLQPQASEGGGEYAHLFDHAVDTLTFDNLVGFDFSYYLDAGDQHVVAVISMYLVHRLMQVMNGQLVSLLIDEAWQVLASRYWQDKLSQWLATLRKYNAHVVLSTQSIQSVLQSPLAHTVLDNCATQWLLPNAQARQADYCDGLGLTEAEYLAIKNMPGAERLFLHKQAGESALLRLDLSALKRYMPLFSANSRSIQLWHEMTAEFGPEHQSWLQQFLARCQQCD